MSSAAGELDLESAQIDLEATIATGEENHAVAVLERRNAQAEKERLEKLVEGSSVVAPVGGVILGSAGGPLALTAGTTVKSGQHLLTISEGRSLAVRGRIDEIRVHEIGIGDRVRVTGAAFPGATLDAKIVQVSAHALQSPSKGLPVLRSGRGNRGADRRADADHPARDVRDDGRRGVRAR